MVTYQTRLITIRYSQNIILTSPANNGWSEANFRHKIQITPGSGQYVFVNLWSPPYGRPWTYAAVYDLVLRLRERTGIDFGPHQYRHTYATWLLRRGAGMETVKECLGHASITTTIDTYGHLTVEDARQTLEAAGWFTGREVRL